MTMAPAEEKDLPQILDLQKIAYQSEARIYRDFSIQPLRQTLDELIKEHKNGTILKMTDLDRIVGSVRAYKAHATCHIGKLMVHPEYQNKGYGRKLMNEIEKIYSECERFELFTGNKSIKNIEFYKSLGYKIYKQEIKDDDFSLIYLEKK